MKAAECGFRGRGGSGGQLAPRKGGGQGRQRARRRSGLCEAAPGGGEGSEQRTAKGRGRRRGAQPGPARPSPAAPSSGTASVPAHGAAADPAALCRAFPAAFPAGFAHMAGRVYTGPRAHVTRPLGRKELYFFFFFPPFGLPVPFVLLLLLLFGVFLFRWLCRPGFDSQSITAKFGKRSRASFWGDAASPPCSPFPLPSALGFRISLPRTAGSSCSGRK